MATPQSENLAYGKPAKFQHWLMAPMIFLLIIAGTYIVGLERIDPSRGFLLGMHKSLDVIFIQLAILWMIWSRISNPPNLPAVLATWGQLLSEAITVFLYLLMLAIPFSGYAMSNLFGHPINLFGLVEMPLMFDKDPELGNLAKQADMFLAYALIGGLIAHIAGALKHRYLDSPEADVLPRMLLVKPRT